MGELLRLLGRRGQALILVPRNAALAATFEDASITDPGERFVAFGQADHVRMYGRDFVDRVRAVGFDVTEVEYAARLEPIERERIVVAVGNPIFACKRSSRRIVSFAP